MPSRKSLNTKFTGARASCTLEHTQAVGTYSWSTSRALHLTCRVPTPSAGGRWCLSAADEAEAVQWERAIEDAIEVQDTERYIQRFHTSARNLHALDKAGGGAKSRPQL